MNTSLTAYTPLESLLLFQSLAWHGVDSHIFSRISDQLKKNPHITAHERFESGRLSPDALRNFYLQLLTEEIRSEVQDGARNGDGQNGDVRVTRKRKAQSPSLPTVQEAAQQTHLIPGLVAKLYARYRTHITNQIRDDESRYDRLQKELDEIKQGHWDEKLRERANGKSPAQRSPSLSKKSPLPHQKPLPPSPSPLAAGREGSRQKTPLRASTPDGTRDEKPVVEELQKPQLPTNGHSQTEAPLQSGPGPSPRKKQPVSSRRGAPSTAQPAPGTTPPLPQGQPPQALVPPPPAGLYPPNANYNGSPTHVHRSPYPPPSGPTPHPQALQGMPINPHAQAHPLPQGQPHSFHAPPPGTQNQPPPLHPHGGNGAPQFPPPPGQPSPFSPTQQRFPGPPGPFSPGSQSPSVPTTQQQRNAYPPFPGQQPYPSPQQHGPVGQPPPQSGFMLPPFQVSPQDPARTQQQPLPQFPQVTTPVHPRLLAPSTRGGPGSAPGRSLPPPIHPPTYSARGSMSTPSGIRTPYSGQGTPRSAKTLWKATILQFPTPSTIHPPVDPISDDDETPKESPPKAKTTRKSRAKPKAKEKEPEREPEAIPDIVEETVPEMETRSGRPLRKVASRRARPGSIASSQADRSTRGRSRSQSVISHTETVAADNESQAGFRVKSERETSVDAMVEDIAPTPSGPSTRRRAGAATGKRKRARESSPAESEDQPHTPGLQTSKIVIAPRHFSRMCNPIMNDIGSHKHASTFTTAVKAKDAEGYYEIIKRPTDLRSINKAVTVGAKVVAAHALDTPAGSPGGGGGMVELPPTQDTMPPKAIVNSAQLEKELMRMFVNAVMFNSGEEGVVEDAREMFESVQQSVSNWRSAERGRGRAEVEDTPGEEGTVEESVEKVGSKRRKV
ncbi:hypothetical protein P154DRAFT_523560 [Amniculicola lignicola CBS 123094]|uniref:Bromo domain-containing protein n=1 Tax=Amniculicola lignicola CBS 123094 TaxID=1392246 RepID=A0A6A5WJ62_9PLEO|nr:hypothetical protein P154DRAFT_523560 [Amniculicola lignicola CBS 123094]